MKSDEEELSAFRRSGKLMRSPAGVPHRESGSETDTGGMKRKDRSGKTPDKSHEKRSRKMETFGRVTLW